MKFRETMAVLRELGTAQNVKIYQRHGAGDKLFGVSFANLNKLKKQIGVDHKLAEQLWRTGNTDAQTLALMIADPNSLAASEADAWLKDIQYSLLADMFAGLIARSGLASSKLKKWTRSKQETTRVCGYSLLASILKDTPELLSDDLCRGYIDTIERQIHASPNLARHAMNNGLIAIGIYKPDLRDEAIAAARRIGKVDVDHGQTSCKTPDAGSYISRAASRQSKRVRKNC
jgi:3-methyladenine DNA glycosylase AlkD